MTERIPSTGERAKAVFKTLQSNRSAQIDGLLGTVGAVSPSILLDIPEHMQQWDSFTKILIGANLALIGVLARSHWISRHEENRRTEAIEGDWGSYRVEDYRTIVGFVRDAWRSGKAQMPKPIEGHVDGIDRIEHYSRRDR